MFWGKFRRFWVTATVGYKKLFDTLYADYLVCPCQSCSPFNGPWFLLKILPSNSINDIVKPSEFITNVSAHIDNSLGYESFYDFVVEIKDIIPSIIKNIKPENLFFFFAEGGEIFDYIISENYEIKKSSNKLIRIYCKKDNTVADGKNENNAEYIAIFLCKMVDVKVIEDAIGGEYKYGTKNKEYYKINWPELDNIGKELCNRGDIHYLDQSANIF